MIRQRRRRGPSINARWYQPTSLGMAGRKFALTLPPWMLWGVGEFSRSQTRNGRARDVFTGVEKTRFALRRACADPLMNTMFSNVWLPVAALWRSTSIFGISVAPLGSANV